MHIIYGGLTGGPNKQDHWLDTRMDYQHNEVALDYNVGFTGAMAFLTQMGRSTPDAPIPGWPHKEPELQVSVVWKVVTYYFGYFEVEVGVSANIPQSYWNVTFEKPKEYDLIFGSKCVLPEKMDAPMLSFGSHERNAVLLGSLDQHQYFVLTGQVHENGTLKPPSTVQVTLGLNKPVQVVPKEIPTQDSSGILVV